jgi:hypothetical protein
MNAIPAETANTPAAALAEQPKLPKKPRVAAQAANVASSKARSGHKATAAKKANRGATSAKPPKKAVGARLGSKAAKVLDLLKTVRRREPKGANESHRAARTQMAAGAAPRRLFFVRPQNSPPARPVRWRQPYPDTRSLMASFGAFARSCLVPRYRSVVCTEACPSNIWICSSSPPAARQSFAQVRRGSWGAMPGMPTSAA